MEALSPGDRVRVTIDIPCRIFNSYPIPLGATGTVVKTFAQWKGLYVINLDGMSSIFTCVVESSEIEPLSEEKKS